MDVDLKILQELKSDDKKNAPHFESDALKITRGAFEKAMLYSKLCTEIAGGGMECYGYLLMPSDSLDGTIADICFADEQLVQSAYVRVTDTAVYKASRDIEPAGYQIVGWWHSHGTMNTFHSGTDVSNFETVLQSVAPRTMYRNKEVLYVTDDNKGEVKFDNFVIKNVDTKNFKEHNPRILKGEEDKPYAFSMVVNVRHEYYLERMTKTFNQPKQRYSIDKPIRPRLMVVDKENDLEFLVSQIEKDIHRKLIFPAGNHASAQNVCPDWESRNREYRELYRESEESEVDMNTSPETIDHGFRDSYTGIISNFVNSVQKYLSIHPDAKSTTVLSKFLSSGPSTYRYDILRGDVAANTTSDIKVISDIKVVDGDKNVENETLFSLFSDKEKLVDQITRTLDDTDPMIYFNHSRKLNINEMRNMLVMHFMMDFNNNMRSYDKSISRQGADKTASSKTLTTNIEGMLESYRSKSVALAEAFVVAEKTTKTLTYYSMERLTDYKGMKNHKYKNTLGLVLENLCTENYMPFNESVSNVLQDKSHRCQELFLYPDRLKIFNQLLNDIYTYKILFMHTKNGNGKNENGSGKSFFRNIIPNSDIVSYKNNMEFLMQFADLYLNEPKGSNAVDSLIEEKLFFNAEKKRIVQSCDARASIPNYSELDRSRKMAQERNMNLGFRSFTNDDEDDDRGKIGERIAKELSVGSRNNISERGIVVTLPSGKKWRRWLKFNGGPKK